ncbi:MAG: VOC family protein [Pseudomonadota bacterium]
MIIAIDHIIHAVSDLAAATEDYATLLGRPPSWRGRHPAYGTANALFRLDNTYVELLAPVGEGPIADMLRPRLETQGEGPVGLVLGADDADAAHARLREAGLAPATPAEGSGVNEDTGAERRWRNVFLPEEKTGGLFLFVIQHLSPPDALPMTNPADLGAAPAAAVRALDHVVVETDDPEGAARLFGEEGMGVRLALDQTFEDLGARLMFFRVGQATVEVAHPMAGRPGLSKRETWRPGATHHFWGQSFRVDDIDAAHARLEAAGVPMSPVRPGRKPGTRVATVKGRTHGAPTLIIGPAGDASP